MERLFPKVAHCHHSREHQRYILGVTSVWLLLPVAIAFQNDWSDYEWFQRALLLWTCMTCIVSTCMYPSLSSASGPFIHMLDKAFARMHFVAVLMFFALDLGPRPFSKHYVLTFPIAIVSCYALSCMCLNTSLKGHSAAHLMFRFVGYWWTYLALTSCNVHAGSVWSNSSLYWGHIVYALVQSGSQHGFVGCTSGQYFRGCAEVGALAMCAWLAQNLWV